MVRKVKTENDENKTVGEILKDARLAAKLSVEKVSDKTRIGAAYLIAIEAGDFNALPGQVYASGFVRTYAKFLGLDAGEIYDKFRDEAAGNRQRVKLAMMEPEREGGVPHKKEILIAIGALIFIYALWTIFSSSGSEKAKEKAPETVAMEKINATVAEQKASGTVSAAKPEAKKDAAAAAKPATAVASSSSAPSASSEKTAASKEESETVEQVDLSRSYGANDGETRVVLVANSEVWLQITDDDKVIFSKVLAKGDKYNVPDYEYDLTLRAGNAASIDVYVDGNKLSPLGKRGTIARDISIDADSLLSRY